jgi:peptidoglycan/xylan/chitin deacetylase (PgdA/CDA1 family)
MDFGDEQYTKKKNRRKLLRVILELAILCGLTALLATALFTFRKYVPFQARKEVAVSGDHGFVALSYFGVARTGTDTLIARERLREHLQALKLNGYETVTQKDIISYYDMQRALPERALFLTFEDGRRDTAIFAQKLLEELNYKGTILTYAEKFALKDTKFLQPRELLDLEQNSFWELGTNGYRLAFINCFDRYGNYLGELTSLKHALVAPYLSRKYNHYLMDYLRDARDYPKESYDMMQDRISFDYEQLRDIYSEELGYVPKAHILMHSNTGAFGNNHEVSAVNEKWITELFAMNFNREGYCFNDRTSSIYDLTRMQPQSYWYANHLLMRIKHDQTQPISFVRGNEDEAAKWQEQSGAAEYKDEKIILTTDPNSTGRIYLQDMQPCEDVRVQVTLNGNKYGTESVYLRADEGLTAPLAVRLSGNYLYVVENGKQLYKLDLREFDGKQPVSVEEDRKASEVVALKTAARYAPTKEQAELYLQRMRDRESKPAKSVAQGARAYEPVLNIREPGTRRLELALRGRTLWIAIDGKRLTQSVEVSKLGAGKVALEASLLPVGEDRSWSQRNLADDVYDGVFEKLMVYNNASDVREEPLLSLNLFGSTFKVEGFGSDGSLLYDSRLHGWRGFVHFVREKWEALLHFFVHSF